MEDVKILYILIGSGTKPLAGYGQYTGEFVGFCENQMSKCKPNSSGTIIHRDYKIYYQNENDITYMLMTQNSYPIPAAGACIESLRKELKDSLEGRNFSVLGKYGLNSELRDKLKMKYEYYTKNPEAVDEHVEELKNVVLAFKNQVIQAAEVLNERGEDLNKLSDQSKLLEQDSYSFKKGAIEVRRTECKRKIWYIIAIVLVIGIIIGIIIWIAR